MKHIIKSIQGKSDEVFLEIIEESLLPAMVLLSDYEKDIINTMLSSYVEIGMFPTVEILKDDYPLVEDMMTTAQEYSEESLRFYIINMVNERKKLNSSQMLMEMASRVAKTGITDEDLDIFDSLYMIGKDDEGDIEVGLGDMVYQYQEKKSCTLGITTIFSCVFS